ncbi:MAG: Gfo/Idh/MocA family oxidoreductase [Planctomycetes bacterium]|nr:Gfo/Idh/MocA family oxidoreductase [Planctomycetota bacterium]
MKEFDMSNENSSPLNAAGRRKFLQQTAAGAMALGSLPLAAGAHVAGSETIRIGMIGCGGRCSGAAAQSLESGPFVKLVAMYDVFEDRVKSAREVLQRQYPEQVAVDDDHCFSEFDGYKHVINSADVVLIACASKFHPFYAEAAIKAGKHVFVEKPHGIDPVGVRRMQAVCDLAKEKGLSLLSGLQSRFQTSYQETIKRIHDGAIGDVVAMQSMFLRGPYRLEPRLKDLTETEYQFRNWYHFRWLSGDDVTQSLVHNADRMAWILGEEMPEWCFGLGGRSSSFGEEFGDMFDHHTAIYEYASGVQLYALCRTQVGCYNNAGDIIMGTKGKCHLHRGVIEGPNAWKFRGLNNNPYQAEQTALIEAVRNNEPINSGYHMANSTMMTILGQLTCYTGKPLKWDEIAQSNIEFGPSPDGASFETPPPTLPDATGNYPLPLPGQSQLLKVD